MSPGAGCSHGWASCADEAPRPPGWSQDVSTAVKEGLPPAPGDGSPSAPHEAPHFFPLTRQVCTPASRSSEHGLCAMAGREQSCGERVLLLWGSARRCVQAPRLPTRLDVGTCVCHVLECVHVHTCVCARLCGCMCACVSCVHTCYASVYMSVPLCVDLNMCVRVYTGVCACVCLCMCMVSVCVCACI